MYCGVSGQYSTEKGMPAGTLTRIERQQTKLKEIPKGIPLCPAMQDGNKERIGIMENRFIRADDVARELSVSKPYAYKLIRQLNEELKAQGFITIAGRVNRQYFYERLYGTGQEQGKEME